MLLLTEAPRARVIAVLDGFGVCARVGPTSTTGWTAAWCSLASDDTVPTPAERHVSIAEEVAENAAEEDDTEVVVRVSGPSDVVSRPSLEPSSQALAAQALVDCFGARDPSAAGRVADALGDPEIEVDDLVALLDELLVLPELTEPEPERSVLVTHCDPAFVRAAARMEGPLLMLAVDAGTSLVGHTTDTPDVMSAAAAISAAEPRKDRTVVLQTRGETMSLAVLRGGSRVGEWTWKETWSSTEAGRAAHPAQLVEQIQAFAAGAADVPRVRRLLTQQEAPSLRELVTALAVPPQVHEALGPDGLASIRGSVLVAPASVREALLGSALDAWRDPRPVAPRHRLLFGLYSAATIAMTAGAVGMAALSWTVIATGGKVVDQAGVTGEDWLFTLLATVLAFGLILTSVHRSRRLRRSGSRRAYAVTGPRRPRWPRRPGPTGSGRRGR